jgi:Helix-turn-helix domain
LQHHEADPHKAGLCGEPGDDRARFLRELRELRAEAGLGHAELAARAHYPCDVIRAAEAGPSLPGLPVLSAYVRGCGGTVAEWEERWRSLTSSPALPLLPARSVGESAAATAGARVGAAPPVGDGQDPALIMAALGRVADGMATDSSSFSSSPSAAVASYGTADAATRSPEPAPSGGTLPGWAAASAASPSSSPSSDVHSPDNATPSAVQAPTVSRPQGGFSTSASGQAAGTRRPAPSRMALATLVVILCLAATLLALFA